MKKDGALLSYASATGYMSSMKSSLVTKFRFHSDVPKQLSPDIWKRYMTTIFGIMYERSRRERKPMHGTKESCDAKDRFGIMAVCIWDGTLHNAELMIFFQSMVMNCGRGCEIGLSRLDHLQMKTVHEPNGVKFATLQQYVNRTKVQSKYDKIPMYYYVFCSKCIFFMTFVWVVTYRKRVL